LNIPIPQIKQTIDITGNQNNAAAHLRIVAILSVFNIGIGIGVKLDVTLRFSMALIPSDAFYVISRPPIDSPEGAHFL
jgi:hypothetical protein